MTLPEIHHIRQPVSAGSQIGQLNDIVSAEAVLQREIPLRCITRSEPGVEHRDLGSRTEAGIQHAQPCQRRAAHNGRCFQACWRSRGALPQVSPPLRLKFSGKAGCRGSCEYPRRQPRCDPSALCEMVTSGKHVKTNCSIASMAQIWHTRKNRGNRADSRQDNVVARDGNPLHSTLVIPFVDLYLDPRGCGVTA